MRQLSHIGSDLTVRQVAAEWPSCATVFASFANAQCDGRWTLQELAPFARSTGIDEQTFLEQLSAAAGVPVAPPDSIRRTASPIPLIFIALAITLSLGASWGVALLLRIAVGSDYSAVSAADVHVHGVAQLWGWMALFIFAVGAHLLRQTTIRPAPLWLERLAAGFVVMAIVIFFIGLSDRVRVGFPAIYIVGSSFFVAASVLFSFSVGLSLAGAARSQRRHGLLFLVGWLCTWAVTDLWLRLKYPAPSELPESARNLLIVLPVLGLGTNAIYGFGLRLIPGLLNIAKLRPRCFSAALMLHNTGLLLFLTHSHWARTIGAAMMLAGAILYLIGMDWLRSKPSRPIYGIDPRGHILIRVAFFWLVCGMAMILLQQFYPGLPHAYSGAWRHALTVGFITTMILGVGQRIVPIFIKQPLASTQLMLAGAALIIIGNAGRVVLELATIGGWPWTFRAMGFTGLLELAALALFALNLAMTARDHRRIYSASEPLTANVHVRDAINVRPELQQRLCEIGITMFDNATFIAPSMTFGALALASGRQPSELLSELAQSPRIEARLALHRSQGRGLAALDRDADEIAPFGP